MYIFPYDESFKCKRLSVLQCFRRLVIALKEPLPNIFKT